MNFLLDGGFSHGECVMKNQMINVNKMQKLISCRKAIVLMILIK